MAPTPNGGRQILCGNSQFAAEEAAVDFPARPRQGAARRPTSPAHECRDPEHPRHLPLSGEGPFARAAHAHQACGRRDAARRSALCHRERTIRLRPRCPTLPAQTALSDAHAQRAAGPVAHPHRGHGPHAGDRTRRPRGRTRRPAGAGRPRDDRALLRQVLRRRAARGAARAVRAGLQLLRCCAQGRLDHQSRVRGRDRRFCWECRSIRCAFAPIST